MDKQAKLDALAEEIVKEKVCSDLADQATQLVMGDGNPDADIDFYWRGAGGRMKICRASRSLALRENSLMKC